MNTYVLLHFEHKNDLTIIVKLHRATRLRLVLLTKVWQWLWRNFYVQNVIEHRYSWNKYFIIYRTNAAQNSVTCCNSSQVVMPLLQHFCVLQSWYYVISLGHVCHIVNLLRDKNCYFNTGVSEFECFWHIHLSLRQSTTNPSMISKSCSLSLLNIARTGTFQYIHSEVIL